MAFATTAPNRGIRRSTADGNQLAAREREDPHCGPSYFDRPPATNQDLMKIHLLVCSLFYAESHRVRALLGQARGDPNRDQPKGMLMKTNANLMLAAFFFLLAAAPAAGQQPSPAAQLEAMKKLNFLTIIGPDGGPYRGGCFVGFADMYVRSVSQIIDPNICKQS